MLLAAAVVVAVVFQDIRDVSADIRTRTVDDVLREYGMQRIQITKKNGDEQVLVVPESSDDLQVALAIESIEGGDDHPSWKVDEWTIASGTHLKVITPPKPGEDVQGPEQCKRHDSLVDAIQSIESLRPVD